MHVKYLLIRASWEWGKRFLGTLMLDSSSQTENLLPIQPKTKQNKKKNHEKKHPWTPQTVCLSDPLIGCALFAHCGQRCIMSNYCKWLGDIFKLVSSYFVSDAFHFEGWIMFCVTGLMSSWLLHLVLWQRHKDSLSFLLNGSWFQLRFI